MPLVISDPFTLSLFNVPAGTNDYSVIVSSSGGSTTSSNAVAVAAPAGMVAWWQAEGNALDSCGVFNGVTNGNTTYVPGKVGQAFNFDGTSGCVFATNLTSLALGRATNLTIECWIKPAALYGHPIVQFSNGTNAGTLLDIYGYGNSLYADLITTNGANYILGAPWNIVNSNTWQHAALTYDRTNAMIYYIKGSEMTIDVFLCWWQDWAMPRKLRVEYEDAQGAGEH